LSAYNLKEKRGAELDKIDAGIREFVAAPQPVYIIPDFGEARKRGKIGSCNRNIDRGGPKLNLRHPQA
jgi:hypothetical protein